MISIQRIIEQVSGRGVTRPGRGLTLLGGLDVPKSIGSDVRRYKVEDRGHSTECHIWTGPHNQKGYGLIKVGRSSRAAHRVIYETARGPVPQRFSLDHLCRVRGCIRLDHLEAVPHELNVRRGANQKLTRADVLAIGAAAAIGTDAGVARQFGVSRPTVRTIRLGEHWLQQVALDGTATPAFQFPG